MPRIVDQKEREREILDAAVKLLADGGFGKLTLSNLARELGGSIRLVTHYFRNRGELVHGIVERLTRETAEIVEQLMAIDGRRERLRHALGWFLLSDEQEIREEKVRLALRDHQNDPAVAEFFDVVEPGMRHVLRVALAGRGQKAPDEADVDLLRVWTSGVALNVIERPDSWPRSHQERAMEYLLDLLER